MKYKPTDLVEMVVWIDDSFFIKKAVSGAEIHEQQTLILEQGALVRDEYEDTWYPPHRISKVVMRKFAVKGHYHENTEEDTDK